MTDVTPGGTRNDSDAATRAKVCSTAPTCVVLSIITAPTSAATVATVTRRADRRMTSPLSRGVGRSYARDNIRGASTGVLGPVLREVGEVWLVDTPLPSSLGPVVDLGGEDLGQEDQVGQTVTLGDLGQAGRLLPHGRQVQLPRRGPDGGLCGGVGQGCHELPRDVGENPILKSPHGEPRRHFGFDNDVTPGSGRAFSRTRRTRTTRRTERLVFMPLSQPLGEKAHMAQVAGSTTRAPSPTMTPDAGTS